VGKLHLLRKAADKVILFWRFRCMGKVKTARKTHMKPRGTGISQLQFNAKTTECNQKNIGGLILEDVRN